MTMIFVFGANEAGRHGAGAALFAKQHHGAIPGHGVGLQGNSYGIPTNDYGIKTLPLDRIKPYVDQFIAFAEAHPELDFGVTRVGCGLAGYTEDDIAPMFENAPQNCRMQWMSNRENHES